jgi:hypothetical protein
MSVGPAIGIAASVAGLQLAQTTGTDVERTEQDVGAQQRVAQSGLKAETAASIGEADGQNHETEDRDADGRLPWILPAAKKKAAEDGDKTVAPPKDPTGQSGNLLDLSG